jgi:hypothetical protein
VTRGLTALTCACLILAVGAPSASGAPTWLAPQDLSASGQDALAAQVGLDAAGNAVAVWRRFNGSNSIVQVSERPAGGSWSEPEDLSALGQNALHPQLAVGPAGDAVVVWRGGGVNGIIKAAVRPAGDDWSAPKDLSTAGPNGELPRVVVDATGDAVAVWLHSTFLPGDASTFIVQAATRPAGGDWSEPEDLADQQHNLDGPKIAMNAAGAAIAVWHARVGSDNVYQAAIRPPGGDWAGPEDIADAAPGEAAPQVALGPAGDAVVVWAGLFSGIVEASERPAGGAWSEPEDLSAAGGEATSPRVAMDATGDAVAAWQRSDGSSSIVQVSERPAGGGWSEPEDVSAAGQDASAPQIALNPVGDAVAVWQRWDGSNEIVQASARRVGNPWSPAQDLSAAGGSAFTPAVAIDATGGAVAVWRRSNGTNDIVQASVYDTSAETGPVIVDPPPPPVVPLPPIVTSPPPPAPKIALSLTIETKSLRALLRTGKLVVVAKVNKAGRVALIGKAKRRVRARGTVRPKFVRVLVGKTIRFARAGEKKVRLALSKKGRRVLSNRRKARLVIAGTATDAARDTARKRATITLGRASTAD